MKLNKFIIIAGPCLAESRDLVFESAERLKQIASKFDIDFIFKASYRKANRTSDNSFSGVGDLLALSWLKEVNENFGLKVITDIHSEKDAEMAANYVDYLQIPAFLCRQTDLLKAAGKTGKGVNIKKGQFVSPDVMLKAAEKVKSTGNDNIYLTERGTFFGYNDLVVDFRAMAEMKKYEYPVLFDATHSVQKPSIGEQSGGAKEFIKPLTRAAVSVGIDGVFFEAHPNPDRAMSDSATQLDLNEVENFLEMIMDLNYASKKWL